jgi:acetyl esterase/lipase
VFLGVLQNGKVDAMSDDEPISRKRVLYDLPGTAAVTVRHDLGFSGDTEQRLMLDLYSPPDAAEDARLPVVVIVAGYPDAGFETRLGCKFKEMQSTVSWGHLIAASGIRAVAYTNLQPADDLHALLRALRRNAESFGIDETRIGLWATSGNVPVALSALMSDNEVPVACAAFAYGLMLDLDGATGVAEAAGQFRFANPCAGRSFDDLRTGVPLFLARAGGDQIPHLNEALDRFVQHALAADYPLTLINHAGAQHAFDLFDDGAMTGEIIRQILAFLRFHLVDSRSWARNLLNR